MSRAQERRPFLYRVTRAAVWFALKIFFQKIDIRHGENIPALGPVLFVANHPNSIMDALVLGIVTRRKVNYIAHAGLFRAAAIKWLLRNCGVIPVYRRQDDPDKMVQNTATFVACSEALERGETIGIFPEGTSDMVRKVKKIKTGAARIVFETEARNDFNLGLQVIPVGLHFYSRSHFRSRVLANIGEPVALAAFFESYKRDNFDGVRALTDEIERRLQALTVNVRDEELDEFVRDLEHIYRDELRTLAKESGNAPDKQYREEFVISKAIADCVQYYQDHEPQRVADIQEQVAGYKRKLGRLHLRDAMLRDSTTPGDLWRQAAGAYGRAIVGFLPALYGFCNNFIPYRIAESIGKHFLFERTKILTALLIGGGVTFLFFYTIQTIFVAYFWGAVWASVYLLSLPLSGFFALAYTSKLREQQENISLSFFLFTNKHLFNRMRRQRRLLIAMIDKIKDEYLQRISQAGTKQGQVA